MSEHALENRKCLKSSERLKVENSETNFLSVERMSRMFQIAEILMEKQIQTILINLGSLTPKLTFKRSKIKFNQVI